MAKKEKILEYINDNQILFEKKKAKPEEIEAAIRRQNIRDKKLEKYFTEKPKPIKPDLVNGHSDWDLSDWLEGVDPGGWASEEDEGKRKVEAESLYEKYLDLLRAGELLPGTTFQMFEKNYLDFDTDVFTKIKKRVKEKKLAEGLAALVGEPRKKTTILFNDKSNKKIPRRI